MSRNTSPDSGTHWTEPGAWPVAPGIYRIPLPLPMDGLQAINVYAIETEDGLTLIDGGWALEVSRRALVDALHGIGRTLKDIRAFLVTHAHRDHYTQAVTLRAEVGAHVSLGIGDRATLQRMHDFAEGETPFVPLLERAGAHDLAAQWAAQDPHDVKVQQWEFPDTWLEADHQIVVGGRDLCAVSTPGHTRGHFVFADTSDGLLFAGDHVLPTITPSVGFEGDPSDQPLGDFLSSLAKVRAMPDLRVLPAHGPVGMSSHTRVDELLEHHEHRLALCLDVVRAGERTAYQVARQLPWTRRNHELDDLDPFNASLATMETRVHLLLLMARGQVTRSDVDGQDVYRLA